MHQDLQEQDKLETVECVIGDQVTHAVIWLHGLGADGHDFVDLIPELKLPADKGVKFIFPHAPMRPVTINQGVSMRAWYDLTTLARVEDDIVGIRQSAAAIQQLIQQQLDQGIASQNIVLAGFSQGGAIALYTALSYTQPLGGVLALSTYLAGVADLSGLMGRVEHALPIFMAHGEHDSVIPLRLAQQSRDRLMQQGYDLQWHCYPMAHEICLQEIVDIRQWLISCLS